MSEVKVNKISPRTNCGTVQLGDSGDTITIPSGATITNNGTQTGFGRSGAVDWDTTAKTASFTAANGEGYFINSAGGAVTVTLPSSPSAGNIVAVSDYNGSASTNAITIARNGSNINGSANDISISKPNSAAVLVYVDGTTGWQLVGTGNTTDITNAFVAATGGTITTCGDFKIHTFTGPGTFSVSSAGNPSGSTAVEYLVVAGGGAGGTRAAGGGGAGGFRFYGECIAAPYPASPLNGPAALPVSVQSYPITVGAGGTGVPPSCNEMPGNDGSNSVFSTISSAGGGGGLGNTAAAPGRTGNGGSGGGGSPQSVPQNVGGSGNTPPVSPPQGNNGGASGVNYNGGGGGGALAAGQAAGPTPGNPSPEGGDGGVGGGFPTTHFGSGQVSSCVSYFSGGGGGGSWTSSYPGPGGTGGLGGGATGVTANTQPSYPTYQANSGTANTGGGGGGAGGGPIPGNPTGSALLGGNGGSGIVIIRYKFQ